MPAPLQCGCSPLHVIWRPEAMESDENNYYYDPNDEANIVHIYFQLINNKGQCFAKMGSWVNLKCQIFVSELLKI